MPSAASLVLADGQSTPVNHTFTPIRVDGSNATFVDRSSGIQAGYPILTSTFRDPVAKSRINKIGVRLSVPVLDTSGTVPVVAFRNDIDAQFMMHELSTRAQRADSLAYFRNYVNSTAFSNAVLDYDRYY